MVTTQEKHILIELEEHSPVDFVEGLQNEIIDVLQAYDYQNFGNTNGCPFLHLLILLKNTLPTYEQMKHVASFERWAKYPNLDKVEFEKWIQKELKEFPK